MFSFKIVSRPWKHMIHRGGGEKANESQHRAPTDSKRTDQKVHLEVQNGALVGVESTGSLQKGCFWDVTLNTLRSDISKRWTINWKSYKVCFFLHFPPLDDCLSGDLHMQVMADTKTVPYWNSLPHRPVLQYTVLEHPTICWWSFWVFKELVSQLVMLANEKDLGFKFEPSC